ncbi:hypothetical protein [Myroides odoratus]|uniref:hypothetical protein n=1 Tax=Myroides odoratus TaxID=256 RepID=UPI0039B07021
MKSVLLILGMVVFLFVSCANDQDNTGERAEKEWNNFIQKHLIGEWKPESITIKPVLGAPVIEKSYASMNATEDKVVLNIDYTGYFKTSLDAEQPKTIHFKWYPKLDELGIIGNDEVEFKGIILHKSAQELVVALPLQDVLPYLKPYIQELNHLNAVEIEALVVNFRFVK